MFHHRFHFGLTLEFFSSVFPPCLQVDHLFRHRLNNSVLPASDYLKQFPAPLISIVAKFISFVSGGFAAILIIIAFLDESLLEGHVGLSIRSLYLLFDNLYLDNYSLILLCNESADIWP